MEPRRLEGDEAAQQIITILKEAGRPLSTREISEETRKRLVRCPDATIVFLNRLRQRGVIQGQRSKERRGWVWWVD
jgi:repressor of nif and glnA expression